MNYTKIKSEMEEEYQEQIRKQQQEEYIKAMDEIAIEILE